MHKAGKKLRFFMHLQDENDGTKVLLRMVGPLLAVVWGGDKHFLYSFFGKCVSIRFGVLPYQKACKF